MKSKKEQTHNQVIKHRHELLPINNYGISFWLIAFSIAIVTFIVFSPSLKCGFTNFDDKSLIVQNPLVIGNSIDVEKIFTSTVAGSDYYPVTYLSFALNFQFGKLDPFGFHLWNILLHVINTLLVFIFIFSITKRNLFMAFFVSLFFGIHPMHVESVTWIMERKDVLFSFFFLIGLITYLYYRESRKIGWYSLIVILFVLSCLSKGTAVIFPAILLLIDYLLCERITRKMVIEKGPLFLISTVFIILTYLLHKNPSSHHFTFIQRLIFASSNVLWYIYKLIIPDNLSAYYSFPNINSIPLIYYLSPIIVVILVAIIYKFLRKEKIFLFGLLFYFFSIFLMLQIIPTGSGDFNMADRYSYLPYIGLLLIIAYSINILRLKNIKFRCFTLCFVVLGALLFSYQSYARTKIWKDSETLWTDVIDKNPNESGAGYFNRGHYYQFDKNDFENALIDYNKAIAILPESYEAYNNRGLIFLNQHNWDLALNDFNKALAINPNYTETYNNRGLLNYNKNNYEAALTDINKAIQLNPNYASAYNNRGLVHEKMGEDNLAFEDFNKTILLDPNYELAYFNRAELYFNENQFDLAITDYNKIISINPENSNAYADIGMIYFNRNQFDFSLPIFNKAIELNSSIAGYWLMRSKNEFNLGRKEDAIIDVQKAQQLGASINPAYLNELGLK